MKNNVKMTLPKQAKRRHALKPGLTLLLVVASIIAFSAQPVLAAKHAAKVIYSFGDVKADGKLSSRGLKKGDLVYSGETVSTIRGRAQIKFTDGGFASLQPNTDYEINEYKFEGKADGNERSFLNLLKGSVRLVTGVIGKANRKNFRIRTAVATIGIRGTQGTLTHDLITNTTTLRGHGGEWDLESGDFSGPVPDGQSFSCNGVSCASITGTRTRSEVSRGSGKRGQRRQAYQQGNQSAPDGQNCDLGGACDELTVKINQHGSFAGGFDDGEGAVAETDFLENLGVVSVGDKPVAFVSDGQIDGDDTVISIVATDLGAVKEAIDGFNDSEESTDSSDASDGSDTFVEGANALLDGLDSSLLAQLESNPASVADEDFATTPDGLVTYGRFVDGNVLIASRDSYSGNLQQRLDTLTNFQSLHFIFGDDLESISFGGVGNYGLTGATYPTAIDGSMMGTMPSSGLLTWNFLSGTGGLLLSGIVFNGMNFTISGDIVAADPGDLLNPSVNSIFTENSVAAIYVSGGMSMTAPVSLDGNFYGENGTSAPLAAGLAYAVDYAYPFVGTAAFGLTGTASIVTNTTIKYAFNRTDMGMSFPNSISNGDDQFPMGTPLTAFTTTFGDSFVQGAATIMESGADASAGVSWARFSPGYTFASGAILGGDQLLDFHAIKTDYSTPDAVIASTTGMTTFNLNGATSPTIIRDIGSSTYVEATGTLGVATFSANFTTGMMTSISYAGAFPSLSAGVFTLATAGPIAINAGTAPLTGTFTDTGSTGTIGCMGGCGLSGGVVNYGFTSAIPSGPPIGVISSFNASGSGGNAFDISGVAFSK